MRISRTFNGTGATVNLGLGFIPDRVRVYNLESTVPLIADWNRNMRSGSPEGVLTTHAESGAQIARLAAGGGISPFYGTVLAAASTANLRPHANRDFRYQGTLGDIDTWTLDVTADRTGHFNKGVPTTHVGVGSIVHVKETNSGIIKQSAISAMTADGDASIDVTLDGAIKTGELVFLGPMYDLIGGSAGDRIPQGITITNNTLNASGNILLVEAWTDDD